ncbi:MAG: long-chain fatty acid--CoA ligase [Alphaproteobacteria bacterium]
MTVGFLRERFAAAGTVPALIHRDRPWGYDWLLAAIDRFSERIRASGIGPGAVVALEADCTPASIAALLALIEQRCIVAPLSPLSWDDTSPLIAVGEVEFRTRFDGNEIRLAPTGTRAGHVLYETLRTTANPGLVLFSSGSTGAPKGAVHDLSRLLRKYETRRHCLRTLMFLLFDHIGGFDTLFYCLSNVSTAVLVEDRSPARVCDAIARHRVEVLPAAPSFLNLLLLSGEHRRHDLSSLRYITYGAEMMPPATLKRLAEAFPSVTLLQKYGTSEVGTLRSHSRGPDSLWVKIGGEGYAWRVLDGKLEVKASSAMLGYLNAPSPFTEDGWFRTGDCVETDGDYIRFLGRASDIVNVGGQKVFPAEVEAVIRQMDNVTDVAVSGEANPILGQVVVARIQTATLEEPAALRARLRAFVGERLEAFKVPVKVTTVDGGLTNRRFKQVRGGAPAGS